MDTFFHVIICDFIRNGRRPKVTVKFFHLLECHCLILEVLQLVLLRVVEDLRLDTFALGITVLRFKQLRLKLLFLLQLLIEELLYKVRNCLVLLLRGLAIH